MHESFWRRELGPTTYPQLSSDLETDVVIVGGGITGLTTGWLLQRRGVRCVIVEGDRIGHGTSGSTSAHVTEVVDEGYANIIREYGQDAAHMVAAAYRTALASITAFASAYDAECRPLDAFLFTENERDMDMLKEEADAARKLGIRCELTSSVPIPRALAGVRYPNQARFHPVRYLEAMAAEFVDEGGRIFEYTKAKNWEQAERVTLHLEQHQITAKYLVLATHTPIRFNLLHTELGPYRSYLVAMALQEEVKDGLYWDTADPYHYLRLMDHGGRKLLLVGGEDHKTGQEDDPESHYTALEQYARERYSVGERVFHWSDEFFEPADGLPYIGASPFSKQVLVGTGYSGVGLTGGTVAALVLADLVTERVNPWAEVFSPSRVKPIVAAKRFISENADVAYRWVADRFAKTEVGNSSEIAPGEGAVMRIEGQQVAMYRSPEGELIARSPVCTHMGCIVGWNTAEKTWDCPCHGGRFHPDGSVLSGPPVKPLDEVDVQSLIAKQKSERS
jgi:glycine/D-amino acid oxidase-like deaminating enzyme/nitrite reductase/ring-hydroxylating ferredoxin subunit